ncbi:PepSY-associated TM helix domain-containing protein [Curvibacter sp. HBC28]|uniref:PepSY-associated TM helix domain-containing protein n=1 Tax=Curvibacter microcysteis TaxID=3026419 RepID=A0ABT5MFF1_9BURK|nr:PepSY-associated TM helix domain-containing protein [Curvibacter sp. HBC28]MDD0814652.1 PepSY-associated TM helix domain-containing protein [Curvibacter sp. HBC28]
MNTAIRSATTTGLPHSPASAPVTASAPQTPVRTSATSTRSRYASFVQWTRKTHGWIGLWGAVLGLVFGLSGIWLNHRAVLKLPPVAQVREQSQLTLPEPAPTTQDEMAQWLQTALGLDKGPNTVRVDPSRPVPWTDKSAPGSAPVLRQPERWQFNFGGPHALVQVEYWQGNRSVGVTTTHNGVLATLNNLHKGTGMSVPWILLVDALAGSMIFLSLSGLVLWVQMNRRRALGVGIFSASLGLTLACVLPRL